MARKTVSFDVEVPDDVSDRELRDWLGYQLGELGGISLENPLVDTELEACFGSVAID